MRTKVCPCCDQPIRGMYCKGCRKIVWKPVEQNITYYLNTRHPDYAHDCSFHGDLSEDWNSNRKQTLTSGDSAVRNADHRMSVSEAEVKKAEIRERMAERKRELKSGTSSASQKRMVQTSQTRVPTSRTRNPLIAIITTIIMMVTIFLTFTMIIVFNTMDDVTHVGWAEAVPEPMATASAIETPTMDAPWPDAEYSMELPVPDETDPGTMEDWEMTDDEVRELGAACNGFGHFPIVFEDIHEVLYECILDAGYEWSNGVFSYNQFIDEYTWYETIYDFTIWQEDEYAGFLNVSVDTVTGEIHGIEMYAEDEKGFFEVADIALKFLERIGTAEDLPSGTEFFETAYKNQGDAGVCIQNGLEVVCDVPDLEDDYEMFRMEICAPGYYTIAEQEGN